jgi:hypothetical protein
MDTRTISKCVGAFAFTLAVSCTTVDNSPRIEVTEANTLGVTALQTTRAVDNGNNVFTLRALSADDQQLASLRLTIGTIADLPQILSGNELGSEIVVSVAGNDVRMVTHETKLFQFPMTPDTAAGQFLALKAVSSVLEREANIFVGTSPAANNGEDPYVIGHNEATACGATQLLTTPIADQCCYTTNSEEAYTMFVAGGGAYSGYVIQRAQNPKLTGCKESDGVTTCTDAGNCYYGPFGFARASAINDGSNPIIQAVGGSADPYCNDTGTEKTFGNVTGINPTGQGCPGSSSGDGDWDY